MSSNSEKNVQNKNRKKKQEGKSFEKMSTTESGTKRVEIETTRTRMQASWS